MDGRERGIADLKREHPALPLAVSSGTMPAICASVQSSIGPYFAQNMLRALTIIPVRGIFPNPFDRCPQTLHLSCGSALLSKRPAYQLQTPGKFVPPSPCLVAYRGNRQQQEHCYVKRSP